MSVTVEMSEIAGISEAAISTESSESLTNVVGRGAPPISDRTYYPPATRLPFEKRLDSQTALQSYPRLAHLLTRSSGESPELSFDVVQKDLSEEPLVPIGRS